MAHPTEVPLPDESTSEDLLSLWSDLEAGLSLVLAQPQAVQEFPLKVRQYDRWMRDLVVHDTDSAFYLLFQLASTSSVGYSASHSLVCASLCHLVGQELHLPPAEHDALIRAALTMNIAMTETQDQLAVQDEKPTAAQRHAIEHHAEESATLLRELGVADTLHLAIVRGHHAEDPKKEVAWSSMPAAERLAQVLGTIDRYAAMISPRGTRSGRTAADSVRSILESKAGYPGEIGQALLRAVGLVPPGSFVALDNGETAVVVARGPDSGLPAVAVLVETDGLALREPRLHRTATGKPSIKAPLSHAQTDLPYNYVRLLQIGVRVRRQLRLPKG
jgi:hypothetical protein